LTGKRLGRWLTERVNGGGAAARIRARETALRGWDGRTAMGFATGCSEWGWSREKKGPRRGGVVRLLFGRGRVRQGAVGVGEPG
jgi:hypothetical protein